MCSTVRGPDRHRRGWLENAARLDCGGLPWCNSVDSYSGTWAVSDSPFRLRGALKECFRCRKPRTGDHPLYCVSCNGRQREELAQTARADARLVAIHVNKDEFPHRRRSVEKLHRLPIGTWDALYEAQEGKCALCGRSEATYRQLVVDHDHSCHPGGGGCPKCVRGLLCQRCNIRMNGVDDDAWLRRALIYRDISRQRLRAG